MDWGRMALRRRLRDVLWGALLLSASAPALVFACLFLGAILGGSDTIVITHLRMFNEWYVEWIMCLFWAVIIIAEAWKHILGENRK